MIKVVNFIKSRKKTFIILLIIATLLSLNSPIVLAIESHIFSEEDCPTTLSHGFNLTNCRTEWTSGSYQIDYLYCWYSSSTVGGTASSELLKYGLKEEVLRSKCEGWPKPECPDYCPEAGYSGFWSEVVADDGCGYIELCGWQGPESHPDFHAIAGRVEYGKFLIFIEVEAYGGQDIVISVFDELENKLKAVADKYSEEAGGGNHPPTVTLTYSPKNPTHDDTMEFHANASDDDDDPLTYEWYVDGKKQGTTSNSTSWKNPPDGEHTITVKVSDDKDGSDEASVTFTVANDCEQYCGSKFEHGCWNGGGEYPDCECVCEKGWEMKEQGCVACEEVCQELDPHAHYNAEKSEMNKCGCSCDGKLEEFRWGIDAGKCECVTGAERVDGECRCKEGFKPSDDGKHCVPLDAEKKAIIDLLRKRIDEATNEEEKVKLMEILNNLMDVKGVKRAAMGGWDGVANTIHNMINRGKMPSIGDLVAIVNLKKLTDIKKWFQQGKKSPEELVEASKSLLLDSKHEIEFVIEDLNKGEHKTISIRHMTGNVYTTGRKEKRTNITIVKGPDGTVTYTLDGKKYFDGKDIDTKLDPGLGESASDFLDDLHRFGLELKKGDSDDKITEYIANRVQREYNLNVELNKKRSEQLKKQMSDKAYKDLLVRMKDAVKSGYETGGAGVSATIEFLNYSIKEMYTQAIEADFSKVAIKYVKERESGRTQEDLRENMNEQLFVDIGWKVADDFKVNENEQIMLDQLEKVYQRYKIYKQRH